MTQRKGKTPRIREMCLVEGCEKIDNVKGYCTAHYKRLWRHGSPTAGGPDKIYHGDTGKPEHAVWASMRDRCNNKNNPVFKHYGARGIAVCERWSDYRNFIADMGYRPSDHHEIERINNNEGYSPSNCRWATRDEQMLNTRRNRMVEVEGKTVPLTVAAKMLNITWDMARYRVRTGRPLEGQKGKHHVK